MKLLSIIAFLAASVLLLGVVAACGDDDEDEDSDGGETAAATTAAATGDGGNTVTVEGKDFSFDPTSFTVAADAEVTVVLNNTGHQRHTLTVYTDEDFTDQVEGADTDFVSGGEEGEFTTSFQGGEYYFRCEVHPAQMTGELTAED